MILKLDTYINTKNNVIADGLSRVPEASNEVEVEEASHINSISPVFNKLNCKRLSAETKDDSVLSEVSNAVCPNRMA